MNKAIFLGLALLFLGVVFSGCISGGISVDLSHCQSNLDSCRQECNDAGYWLGSDRENCKSNCVSAYNTCMGK